MAKVELGMPVALYSTKEAVRLAKAIGKAGLDRVAVPDTKPKEFHACYPAMTAMLLETERVIIGPTVSNPVTRHWSVQATTAKAFEELAPGRYFLGFGTGDGSVHSVGLHPAKMKDMEDYMVQMRAIAPPNVNIHMAFSGPKGMELAGRHGTELTLGVGLDVGAMREMARRARAARTAAGITTPLSMWGQVIVYLADDEAEAQNMRKQFAGICVHLARFSLDFSFEGKNVPEKYQPIIRERMKHYDFAYHGMFGDTPTGRLYDDHPEIRDYIINRFSLIGTRDQCAERLKKVVREAELDGMWLIAGPKVPTPEAISASYREACEVFGDVKTCRA
jgi:alkanesulfonate monooxygenase SsuD/methylene tetrahydromethanopterin reductase-like flavin-dependent oxidoreductase (luciferase family)